MTVKTQNWQDRFIKWLSEQSGEQEHLVMLMQSVYVDPGKLLSFITSLLEERDKEWREKIAIALTKPVERKPGGTIHELNYDAVYDLLEEKK